MGEVVDFNKDKKVSLVDKDGNAANIGLGTAYEMNQTLIDKESPLSKSAIRNKIQQMACSLTLETYYLLLCRELTDYTFFIYGEDTKEFKAAMYDCITNRGECRGIDKQKDGSWEIWITIDGVHHVYYFFNCDQCVIPC
jgi:hypothetical protein